MYSLAFALVSTSAAGQTPNSVASTSLCGDSYVLALLADAPERISALSWQSRHDISRAPENLRSLPQSWDDIEAVLSLASDHIIYGSGEGFSAERFLKKSGTDFTRLNWTEDFDGVHANVENLGKALGAQREAARLNAQIKTRLAALSSDRSARILYLSRSGGSAGPGTYVDAAIRAAGGVNVMTAKGWVNPDPEFLLSLKPDLILTSFFDDGYASINAAPIRHKTVRSFIDQHARLDIPGAVWPCAGPGLIEAAELIHAKIKSLP